MKRFLLFACFLWPICTWAQKKSSVDDSLQSKSGNIAEADFRVKLSCSRTLTNETSPLFVIDGIATDNMDLASLDIDQIENIAILKTAECYALDGNRASNGVIIINLKRRNMRLKIIDANDSLPIDLATVAFSSGNYKLTTTTNEEGEVVIPAVPQCNFAELNVTSIGYEPIAKQLKFSRDFTEEIILLKRRVKKLDELVVVSYDTNRRFRCWSCGLQCRLLHEDLKRNNERKSDVAVYPNPVSQNQMLTIIPKKKVEGYYQVISVGGQVVHAGKVNTGKDQTFRLSLSNCSAGIYFIRLTDAITGHQVIEKFIVQ